MIDRTVAKFPQLKVVATTLREVHSTNEAYLERGGGDQRRHVRGADVRDRRLRSRRRRRRVCVRPVLWTADR